MGHAMACPYRPKWLLDLRNVRWVSVLPAAMHPQLARLNLPKLERACYSALTRR